jgi:chromosome partitioning protein
MATEGTRPEILLSQAQIGVLTKTEKSIISRKISKMNIARSGENDKKREREKFSLDAVREISREILKIKTPEAKVLQFFNYKGGVGKTVLSSQVAFHLSLMGFKVLAFDLDPQAHMTKNLGFINNGKINFSDVITGVQDIEEVIVPHINGLDIIPSTLRLSRAENELFGKNNRETIVKRLLAPILDNYDYIIIDTNPSISFLNYNAMLAADQIFAICQTEPNSLDGMIDLFDDFERFENDMEVKLNVKVVGNMYAQKSATSQEILGLLRNNFKDGMLQTVIRKSEDINLATKYERPIIEFAKMRSVALEDIINFTHEIAELTKGISKKKLAGEEKETRYNTNHQSEIELSQPLN